MSTNIAGVANRFVTKFLTGIRWYKSAMETINHMTFIYDPNWNPNNTPLPTFPVCFFHVKSMKENMQSEVSQKQMLFYNSATESEGSASLDSGLLNVVADNIVTKPKSYRLDVVIPYSKLTLLSNSFVYNSYTLSAITNTLIQGALGENSVLGKLTNFWDKTLQPYLTLISTFVSTLLGNALTAGEGADPTEMLGNYIKNVISTPDYNKNSLEIMWRMRHIIKMKVWNSWDYKYLAITNCEITKEGTEDGVYEATLTVQEMPVITMYQKSKVNAKVKYTRKNPLLEATGKTIIKTLDTAGGILGQ